MGGIPDCIEREIAVPAPIDRVWRLVSDPAQLARWYPGVTLEARIGAPATFDCGAEQPYLGVVDRVDPPYALAWRWCLKPGVPVGHGPTTRVEITLHPAGSQTGLRLTECGYATMNGSDRDALWFSNSEGWDYLLGELATLAVTDPIPRASPAIPA